MLCSVLLLLTQNCSGTPQNKVSKLLEILERRDDSLFDAFINALRKTGQHSVAQMLQPVDDEHTSIPVQPMDQ